MAKENGKSERVVKTVVEEIHLLGWSEAIVSEWLEKVGPAIEDGYLRTEARCTSTIHRETGKVRLEATFIDQRIPPGDLKADLASPRGVDDQALTEEVLRLAKAFPPWSVEFPPGKMMAVDLGAYRAYGSPPGKMPAESSPASGSTPCDDPDVIADSGCVGCEPEPLTFEQALLHHVQQLQLEHGAKLVSLQVRAAGERYPGQSLAAVEMLVPLPPPA